MSKYERKVWCESDGWHWEVRNKEDDFTYTFSSTAPTQTEAEQQAMTCIEDSLRRTGAIWEQVEAEELAFP